MRLSTKTRISYHTDPPYYILQRKLIYDTKYGGAMGEDNFEIRNETPHIGLSLRNSESLTGLSYHIIATNEYRSNPKSALRVKNILVSGPKMHFS